MAAIQSRDIDELPLRVHPGLYGGIVQRNGRRQLPFFQIHYREVLAAQVGDVGELAVGRDCDAMWALADRNRGEWLQGARVRDGHVAWFGVGVRNKPLIRRHEDMSRAPADFPAGDDAELVGVSFDSLVGGAVCPIHASGWSPL